jgi:hypothetical protein
MESEERPKGFQVRDRRRFTETGEVREEAAATESAETESAETGAPGRESAAGPGAKAQRVEEEEHAPITLATFLVSLSTQALVLLGEIPNPVTGETETDLAGVREIIDLIAMLQEKTRGNVDPGETQIFEKILFDLRMRYVEKVRT